MKNPLVGRQKELDILSKAQSSNRAEMVAVIGRRRVGKTFLIRSFFNNEFDFEITGIQNAPQVEQLKNFKIELEKVGNNVLPIETPKNWFDAFILLIKHLESSGNSRQKVVFFDELPWLATNRSGFLRALSYFWNSWADRQNVIVIICGSAASWMIQKVVNHKGGLHNRITRRIFLKPFNLSETEAFLESKNIFLDRYQILQIYMAMGGIPHYLDAVEEGLSATQNIDQICFSDSGLLNREFSRLYAALFDNSENHITIIRALSTKNQGMTRQELIKNTKFSDGGGLTKVLEELTESGFISKYYPFGKKKRKLIYRLTDEYSLFYLNFMENKTHEEDTVWQKLSQTQTYKTWSGYAFESICLKHIPQIKKALSIAGIYSESASFYQKGEKKMEGAQIDLVIDRNDQVINLFEIKFYNEEFTISKEYADKLRKKMSVFRLVTKTKKQLFYMMITTFGLKKNQHSIGLIVNDLTIDDLFDNQ
ncbi:ATP-binding protein [Saprospiraceae bacterium]|jgi:AAA+ ATPase superfamily predicted ATPase|nr:ATP-binding protein [Bacteroidota bacterium]MDB4727287.1 ATP-binding protein [Saprospiraceae bacterium]MDF1864776.1 ATP-binding protein [Saprospiraceae bacterium]